MPSSARLGLYAAAAATLGLGLARLAYALGRQAEPLDDSYVYFRYAMNLRRGLGVAWNPDGAPTYGLPSQLWSFVLLPFTYLPTSGETALEIASWLVGVAALGVMALALSRHAASPLLRSPPLAFVVVGLPLLLNARFFYHLTTGMDTMLALLANSLLVLGILGYAAQPRLSGALRLGVLGFVAVLVRPENLPCALLVPLCIWVSLPGPRRWRELAGFAATFLALGGADLLVCMRYFDTPFPTGLLGDSLNSYVGFVSGENAVQYGFTAALCVLPFLGIWGGTVRGRPNAIQVALLLPAAATLLWLLVARQHMGFQGRYYVPFLPFVIVPALLSFDRAWGLGPRRAVLGAGAGIAAAYLLFVLSLPLQRTLGWNYLALTLPRPAMVPTLVTSATAPLPATDWAATLRVVGTLVGQLPRQVVVGAAEVGYLGYASPDKVILDLVGLHEPRSQVHGFSMEHLLARAPDLVWLPPRDYTGLSALLLSDPRFFARYEIVVGAFNNGIALRRDGPFRDRVRATVEAAWHALYPGTSLEHYVARGPQAAP